MAEATAALVGLAAVTGVGAYGLMKSDNSQESIIEKRVKDRLALEAAKLTLVEQEKADQVKRIGELEAELKALKAARSGPPTGVSPVAPEVAPAVAPAVAPVVAPGVTPVVAPDVTPVVAPVVAPGVTPVVAPVVAPGVLPERPNSTPVFRHGTSAPMFQPTPGFIEPQESLGCGRHALNNLLGGKYFIKDDGSDITSIEELRIPVSLQTLCRYNKLEPNDCPEDENYSFLVLVAALQLFGIEPDKEILPASTDSLLRYDDPSILGFLIHKPGHWTSLRRDDIATYTYSDSIGSVRESGKLDALYKKYIQKSADKIHRLKYTAITKDLKIILQSQPGNGFEDKPATPEVTPAAPIVAPEVTPVAPIVAPEVTPAAPIVAPEVTPVAPEVAPVAFEPTSVTSEVIPQASLLSNEIERINKAKEKALAQGKAAKGVVNKYTTLLKTAKEAVAKDVVPMSKTLRPSATVPGLNRVAPPLPPGMRLPKGTVNATRRNPRKKVSPPRVPGRPAWMAGSRKKKLRTRRGSKQKNVRRSRRS